MSDLVVIVGPTAAGKTALGVELAARLGGEVVSADAFAVYRGLDIGTAKPDATARSRVPHHLVDIADPRQRYSAGEFVRDADAAIADITARGRRPIVVGGTLFYVRALLHGLFPEPDKDPSLRHALEREWRADPDAVRRRLASIDPEAAGRIAPADRQRILRALEVGIGAGKPMSELWREARRGRPRYRFSMLGLKPPRPQLHARIAARVREMFAAGFVGEVRRLLAVGVSAEAHAMKAIGYRECCRVVAGRWTEDEAQSATLIATRQFAKRQLTWLRGELAVSWLSSGGGDALAEALSRLEASGGSRSGETKGRGQRSR
jgi:tRNA dimethylallyltransferase